MDARKKKIVAYLRVEAGLMAVLLAAYLFYRVRSNSDASSKPDIHVTLRHVETTLTEIDLTNDGKGSGPVTSDIQAHWSDAELNESAALQGFDRKEARHEVTFHPQQVSLAPGETRGVGWVRLTDDTPLTADFTEMGPASQP